MYTQCPRKSNWDKYTRAILQPKPCHPFFVILPHCISLSHSPDRMLDNSYVAVTRMNEFRGRKQCVHVSMSLLVFVCDRLCHCMLVPRNFFILVCLCASLLIYCGHRVYDVRAPHDRWQVPCEGLERSQEQGTDVFQVEKRQQNLFKVLSKAPSAVTLLIHNWMSKCL